MTQPGRGLLEIGSWRVAAEVIRRYPGRLQLIETHPGGGQYDCLTIVDRADPHRGRIDLNRAGSVHISHFGGDGGTSDPEFWERLIGEDDPKRVVDDLCTDAGLAPTGPLPELSADAVVYRYIAAFLTHGAFGRTRWECRNGYADSAGDGGSGTMTGWFEAFPGCRPHLDRHVDDDLDGISAYRFWFVLRNGDPQLGLETTGRIWDRRGSSHHLPGLYRGRIWPVVCQTAGHLLL